MKRIEFNFRKSTVWWNSYPTMDPKSNAKKRFFNGNGLAGFDVHPAIGGSIPKLKRVDCINASTATFKRY